MIPLLNWSQWLHEFVEDGFWDYAGSQGNSCEKAVLQLQIAIARSSINSTPRHPCMQTAILCEIRKRISASTRGAVAVRIKQETRIFCCRKMLFTYAAKQSLLSNIRASAPVLSKVKCWKKNYKAGKLLRQTFSNLSEHLPTAASDDFLLSFEVILCRQ